MPKIGVNSELIVMYFYQTFKLKNQPNVHTVHIKSQKAHFKLNRNTRTRFHTIEKHKIGKQNGTFVKNIGSNEIEQETKRNE